MGGIGSALARIVNAILNDQHAILTVCSPKSNVVDMPDITLALPHIVGRQGILSTLSLPLDQHEEAALQASAKIIWRAINELEMDS